MDWVHRYARIVLRAAAVFVLVLLLVALALPAWFPWALRPWLARSGIEYGAYHRIGYNRLALEQVHGSAGNVSVRVARVESLLPFRWLWSRYVEEEHPVHLMLSGVLVEVGATDEAGLPPGGSTAMVLDRSRSILPVVRAWLPRAWLTDGVFRFGTTTVEVSRVELDGSQLSADFRSSLLPQTVHLRATLSGAEPRHACTVGFEPSGLQIQAELIRTAAWELIGQLNWQESRARWRADFDAENWWPVTATIEADDFRVPASALNLGAYGDVQAALQAQWNHGTYALQATAQAAPAIERFPPVTVRIAAHGDWESLRLDELELRTPWLEAQLSEPLFLQRGIPHLPAPGQLSIRMNLSRLPDAGLSGILEGSLRAESAEGLPPRLSFALNGSELCLNDLLIPGLEVAGTLEWPWLDIASAHVQLSTDSVLDAAGRLDLSAPEIVTGWWNARGAWLHQIFPAGWSYEALQAGGELHGSFPVIEHTGRVEISGLNGPRLRPLEMVASWAGKGRVLSSIDAQFEAGDSTLALWAEGTVSPGMDLTLRSLRLRRQGRTLLSLEHPAVLTLVPDGHHRVADLQLQGDESEVSISAEWDWPLRGDGQLVCRNLLPADWADFLEEVPGDLAISELSVSAQWDNGPLRFDASLRGTITTEDEPPVEVTAKLQGREEGVWLGPCTAANPEGEILSVVGQMPVRLFPCHWPNLVQVMEDQPLDLQLQTSPNTLFWQRIHRLLGVRLVDPSLAVDLAGTAKAPTGTIRGSARGVVMDEPRGKWPMPAIADLQTELIIDSEAIRCERLEWTVEGQPVNVTGRLPMGREAWDALLTQGRWPDWRQATGQVRIAKGEVSSLTRYLPAELRPQGQVSLDLSVVPGPRLTGFLSLTNAATRPFFTLGPIRDLSARVRFDGESAEIEYCRGHLSGQTVALAGRLTLAEPGRAQFDLTLQGENIPLVREPGLVIRSDLDLRLRREGIQPATLSGELRLRDSLFLKDLRLLAPRQPSSPTMHPPYFRIEEPPLADWRLDVRIAGERFLQVRSPVFLGQVSAGFALSGTLRDPVAVGEARITAGRILFPFADLEIERGWVSLRRERPEQPELVVMATGGAFGYDLTMYVTGPANDPEFLFTSMPPLGSEQILLMLTAGELPEGEYTFTSQQRASTLALYLGREMLSRLGADEATADRLTVRTGEEIAEQGNLTYTIEYRVNDRLSLVGEYDRFNALNAGVKWKLLGR